MSFRPLLSKAVGIYMVCLSMHYRKIRQPVGGINLYCDGKLAKLNHTPLRGEWGACYFKMIVSAQSKHDFLNLS